MPYIDSYAWFDTRLCPQKDEGYAAFMARCVPGIMALEPDMNVEDANKHCERAWGDYILKQATEVTITMKRELFSSQEGIYMDSYLGDWTVSEVHSAVIPTMNVTYSALEKANAVTGEVFKIAKAKTDEQLVFGWANVAIDETGQYPLDWDGDITAPEDLEKAAYQFVLKYRATGENHQGEVKGDLVESIMFTKQKQEALGIPDGVLPQGWWVGFHVPEKEIFEKIKSGEYEMFSVQGTGYRAPTNA